jgi:hypothetical protein
MKTSAWLLSALGCIACGEVVVLEEAAPRPHDNGEEPCLDPEEVPPPDIALRDPESATFVGDDLHVVASIDGTVRYAVLAPEGDAAQLLALPKLEGSASLVRVRDDRYVRPRFEEGLGIDFIDTSVREAPVRVITYQMAGEVPERFQHTFSVHDGRLFLCAAHDSEPLLSAMDVDGYVPGELAPLSDSLACGDFQDAAVAADALWVSWIVGDDVQMTQIWGYDLAAGGVTGGVSFGYNPTGVHQYGVAAGAATDGTRIVLDTVSDRWFLLFDAEGNPSGGPYVAFGLPGPKALLTVAAQKAYFATADGVHAYDVSDIQAPALTDFHAEIALDPDTTRLLAAGAHHLALADTEGNLYLVPLDRSGPVAPVRVYRSASAPPPDGCE